MGYKLIISVEAKKHLDNIISYIVFRLKNPEAALLLLDSVNKAYSDIETFPEAWALCNDSFLSDKGYRKYVLPNHNYVILYRVSGEFVKISGIFHVREDYSKTL